LTDDEDDARKLNDRMVAVNPTPMPVKNGEGSGKGNSPKED
jgi:hypothetical protein